MSSNQPPFIRLRGVTKRYETPSGPLLALQNVNLDIAAGEFLAVLGRSGSGKSTLLHMIAGIDTPTEGEIHIGHIPVHTLDQEQLASWRGKKLGVLFQFFQLIPTLTIVENVMLPMDFCQTYPSHKRRLRALELLNRLGVSDQADKWPADLSGGQQQRAALARALANGPSVLVADEPTGNLDSRTSEEVLFLLKGLAQEGTTVVMVSHERDLGCYVDRSICLSDGVVTNESAQGYQHA